MEQLEKLWKYQQLDMKADKFEASIKKTEIRQKYSKCREALKKQQENAKRIESEINARADRIAVLQDAARSAQAQFNELMSKINEKPDADLDEITSYIKKSKALYATVAAYETEVAQIAKEMQNSEKEQKDIVSSFGKYKAEYNKLKEACEAETQKMTEQLDQMRAEAEKECEGVSPELMEKYRSIKSHIVPPLAKLNFNQCGGCNMSLPSAVARNLKAGQSVECENCGRLLIL